MTSDPQRWRKLSSLFDRAVDLDPDARRALLDAECAGDSALREDIERMLAADTGTGVLDGGVAALVDHDRLRASRTTGHDAEEDARASVGTRLGAWQLEGVLGRGGMGIVYAARRDDRDTLQRAAIKRLHRRWDGSLQAQRFLQERRILAALSHPHLPRLLDHGVDDDGRPWFALELVEGKPLNLAADARRLDLDERIDLFRQVCAAVQHAHEHFVVHRDLKPANILVDDGGNAKVLDFGVAKRIDDAEGTTRTGAFAGFTPEYAAPEQVQGGPISAATDVYALGVILYQLLSGRLPYRFDHDDLRATADAIVSATAARLDQAIGTGTPDEVSTRLQQRGTDAKAFRRFVRGDLSRIVQTALAKEPARRYASVQALSSDLGRFLQGRTVSVSGDTWTYRARKFVRRNRWGAAMGTLAVVALVGGSVFSLHRAAQEREQRERSDVVLTFMSDLFFGDANEGGYGMHLTAVDLLDRAAGRIDGVFVDDPVGKADLLGVIAGVYVGLDKYDEAAQYARRAVDLSRKFRDRLPRQHLLYVGVLGDALSESRDYDALVALADAELPFAREHDDEEVLSAGLLRRRGWALMGLGRLEEGERDLRASIALYEGAGVDSSLTLGKAYNDLALLVSDAGRAQEALELLERVDAIAELSVDASPADRLINKFNRARELFRLGRAAESVALLDKAIPAMDAISGPAYSRSVTARNLLAQSYASLGRNAEALAVVERNLGILRAARDTAPDALTMTSLTRAKLLTYSGRAAEALPLARAGVAALQQQSPEPSAMRGRVRWVLGETLLQLDRCEEAEPLLRGALSDERAMSGETATANAGEALDSLGRCRMARGDAAGAVAELARAEAQFAQSLGADDRRTLRSRIHRLWAEQVRAPTPATRAALVAARGELVTTLGTEDTAVVWQLDLMLDALNAPGDSRLGAAAREQLRRKLAQQARADTAPTFVGLNSFS